LFDPDILQRHAISVAKGAAEVDARLSSAEGDARDPKLTFENACKDLRHAKRLVDSTSADRAISVSNQLGASIELGG
jgi:hypothetical protein